MVISNYLTIYVCVTQQDIQGKNNFFYCLEIFFTKEGG